MSNYEVLVVIYQFGLKFESNICLPGTESRTKTQKGRNRTKAATRKQLRRRREVTARPVSCTMSRGHAPNRHLQHIATEHPIANSCSIFFRLSTRPPPTTAPRRLRCSILRARRVTDVHFRDPALVSCEPRHLRKRRRTRSIGILRIWPNRARRSRRRGGASSTRRYHVRFVYWPVTGLRHN